MWDLIMNAPKRVQHPVSRRSFMAALAACAAALAILAPSTSLASPSTAAHPAPNTATPTAQALSRLRKTLAPDETRKRATQDVSYNAVYRWSFQTYVDCDYVGFY